MDIAIVTGADTKLGLSLISRLLRKGYRVHGIGNNFSKLSEKNPQFKIHPVDLTRVDDLTEAVRGILIKEKSLDLLIHAIDITPGTTFEKLPLGNLEAILKIGLLGPVMMTRLALPNLLRFRGQLINVIPANKSGCAPSAVNALLEDGLRGMNSILFDHARDSGLRITNILLRQNVNPDALSVQSSKQTRIDLEDVARVLDNLIDPHISNVPAELVLHPRASSNCEHALPKINEPIDPYTVVVLPPRDYSPPKEDKILTQEEVRVERTIPYTEDEMEDKIAIAIEDFEAQQKRQKRRKSIRGNITKKLAKSKELPKKVCSDQQKRDRKTSVCNSKRAPFRKDTSKNNAKSEKFDESRVVSTPTKKTLMKKVVKKTVKKKVE